MQDYEYALPANLKLVGGSGPGEEGGEKLNTAFERRVLRRLERFLNNLPAPDKVLPLILLPHPSRTCFC